MRQQQGRDYRVEGRVLVFDAELRKEGRLGFWRWFWGAWGIGTYRKDDQVDVAWEIDGRPASPTRSTSSAEPGASYAVTARRQGARMRRAPRIARVAGERLSV